MRRCLESFMVWKKVLFKRIEFTPHLLPILKHGNSPLSPNISPWGRVENHGSVADELH